MTTSEVDLGVGKVASLGSGSTAANSGRLSKAEQFGEGWRAEWLRLRGLQKWADYFRSLEELGEEEPICARV